MDAQLEDRIDKFCFLSAIRGVDISDGINFEFNDVLETLEWYKKVRNDPNIDPDVHGALLAHDQGLTAANFNDYYNLKEQRRDEENQRLKEERIRKLIEEEQTIPAYIKIQTVNKFENFESEKYRTCYHFKFLRIVNKKPIEMTCRIFKLDNWTSRIWYSWRDPLTKKVQRHKQEIKTYANITYAPWIPEFRRDRWRTENYWVAISFVYAMTTNWVGPFKNLIKPGVKPKDNINDNA